MKYKKKFGLMVTLILIIFGISTLYALSDNKTFDKINVDNIEKKDPICDYNGYEWEIKLGGMNCPSGEYSASCKLPGNDCCKPTGDACHKLPSENDAY